MNQITSLKTSLQLFALSLCIVFTSQQASAQFNVGEKIKNKTTQRLDQRIDEGIDKGLDKMEEDAKKSTSKKHKKGNSPANETQETASTESTASSEGSKSEPAMASYSKFDFVPGDRVIFFDDFSQDPIGDFPLKWNTNGNGEVVNTNKYEGKWFKMKNGTTYMPEINSKQFPENYTIEYDLIFNGDGRNGSFNLELTSLENRSAAPNASDPTENTAVFLTTEIQNTGEIRYLVQNSINTNGQRADGGANTDITDNSLVASSNEKFHISITVNATRLRYYVNAKKVLDLPKVMPKGTYNAIIFRMWGWDESIPFEALMGNFRYAEGTTDARSKLITEGKLVTRGILFDVNSDKIKPESYGTLKEIAKVLNENPTVKVKIIGHTDSDGKADANLELSKRRAASVKNSLSKEFGVTADRMETDGKGAGEPSNPNTTPEGKAQNRRVEFIKL